MKLLWLSTILLADLVSESAFADNNKHLNPNSNSEQRRDIGKDIDRNPEKRYPATEPSRSLPLENHPIQECTTVDKRLRVVFEKNTGFESIVIYEGNKALGKLDCAPATKEASLYTLECTSPVQDGFLVKFTYPENGKMHVGELAEKHSGHTNRPSRITCKD